jgi:hypothetical protein
MCFAQVVYEPVNNNPVYELLDELAALKVITINSVVKPYSRAYVANKFNQALENGQKLNKRQLEEVRFYLKDYSFENGLDNNLINGLVAQPRTKNNDTSRIQDEGFRMKVGGNNGIGDRLKDSASRILHPASFNLNPISFRLNTAPFKLSISPWFGTRFMVNENGNFLEVSGGGEVYGYLTKHIGYYVNVKHVHQSEPLVNPVMFSLEEGKSWNLMGDGSVYNTEWRGGISVGWKWGDFGLFKDRPIWGNAVHGSNIMSGHAPSFPYFQLHLRPAKWIEFYSMTGFLQSNVVDSSRSSFSSNSDEVKYHKKYFSANFFTITPWNGLDISVGNSIFWGEVFKVGYLLPFNLYKAFDQSQRGTLSYTEPNVNMNDDGHIFMDISSRNIKHLQLYVGWWIDDWVSSYFLNPDLHNAFGWKLGMNLYDLPLKNLAITVEGSINRPRIYQEYNPVNSYANEDYNFGNYLRDDSWEIFVCFHYRPIRGLAISASYNLAQRGGYIYMKDDYTTYPISGNLVYNRQTIEINCNYQVFTNANVFLGYSNQQYAGDLQFTPLFLRGQSNTIALGINVGF